VNQSARLRIAPTTAAVIAASAPRDAAAVAQVLNERRAREDPEKRRRSLHLDVAGPYHLGPFIGFLNDILVEFSRRHRARHAAEVSPNAS